MVSALGAQKPITQFAYDNLNRLTQITRPDNQLINFTYGDTNVKITTDIPVQGTDRRQDITAFDGLARPIRTTVSNSSGIVISNVDTQYDPMGNVFKVSMPYLGSATDFTEKHYDALGRITRVIAPTDGTANSTTTLFSYSGNTLTVTDPAGKQIQYILDARGRLGSVYEPDINNGNSLTQNTSYAYTVRDELSQVVQGTQSRTYTYDDAGRLTQSLTPESGSVTFLFNNFDLPTQRTDARGVITTYSYDPMNA